LIIIPEKDLQQLIEGFDQKDSVILGRLLKEVENRTLVGYEFLKYIFHKSGHAHIIGITGPPGSGKSTLIAKLCKFFARQGFEIGVVCIDPTSIFSGGALLGDRIRMQDVAKIPNVFIKSLATRGNLGGLATSTADIVQVFDAFGKDMVIVETVGVGQAEVDILEIADTIVLVTVPDLGDMIQVFKAGIMEIADIYVVNKADRNGAEETIKDLQFFTRERGKQAWQPPVISTIAANDVGIKQLAQVIEKHKEFLHQSQLWQKKRQTRNRKRLLWQVEELLRLRMEEHLKTDSDVKKLYAQVEAGKLDPYSAANRIIEMVIKD